MIGQTNFGLFISILQIIGAAAVFVSLAILIFRMIMYKDNADKRSIVMGSFGKFLVGVIIIGSLGLIVSFLFGYLSDLSTFTGSPFVDASANASKGTLGSNDITAWTKVGSDDGGGILSNALGSFITYIAQGIISLFGLKPIGELIGAQTVTIFTTPEWAVLKGMYSVITVPAIIFLSIMVFKTGFDYLMGAINPKEAILARENLMRWFLTIIMLAFGFSFCELVIALANLVTQTLNTSMLSGIGSQYNFDQFIKGAKGFTGGIIALYFSYITLRINVLFIIRDITLAIFIVFTPLAITFWGINKNINAFSVWLGELLSNAFMAFFLSLSFMVFNALLIALRADSNIGNSYFLLFVIVGLTMLLKVSSVLRNTLQGWLTKMSGLNEDDIANKASVGGMIGGFAKFGSNSRNLKRGMKAIKDIPSDGKKAFNVGKAVVSSPVKMGSKAMNSNVGQGIMGGAKNAFTNQSSQEENLNTGGAGAGTNNPNTESKRNKFTSGFEKESNRNKNKNASLKARMAAATLKSDAIKNNAPIMTGEGLGGINKNGQKEVVNDNAIRNDFLENVANNGSNPETETNKATDNVRKAAESTINKIADTYDNNEGALKEVMGDKEFENYNKLDENIPEQKKERENIRQAVAQNQFAKAIGVNEDINTIKDGKVIQNNKQTLNGGVSKHLESNPTSRYNAELNKISKGNFDKISNLSEAHSQEAGQNAKFTSMDSKLSDVAGTNGVSRNDLDAISKVSARDIAQAEARANSQNNNQNNNQNNENQDSKNQNGGNSK